MFKIAFLFPGQGSQVVGMGKEIYETYDIAREFFDHACELVDFDMQALCFDGPIEQLSQTEYTQACLVAIELMIFKVLESRGLKADMMAGLSLGEYSALSAAGALSTSEAIKLVRCRGQIMGEALPAGMSTMAAILGMETTDLEDICQEASVAGVVEIANYNCPGQVVIGGVTEAVKKACELATLNGARKVVSLNVSGAFHTSLLKEAGIKLREELEKVKFKDLKTPVIFNKTAKFQDEPITHLMKSQVSSPVRFEETIRLMLEEGIDTFIEIGPGKTLSSFVKKVNRKVTTHQVNDVASITDLILKFGGHV